ncbi:MAG: hypothetical protein D6758_04055 [Gammaproteobacteria bacterium]|nr:MAG: hypothetical protein D6758_04055 [Gammaproteobacteria bacterium]
MDDADSSGYRLSTRLIWIVATLALGLTLFLLNRSLYHPAAPWGLLSLELTRHLADIQPALSHWLTHAPDTLWTLMYLQIPFAIAWTACLVALGHSQSARRRDLFLAGFALAGFCDLIKGIALFVLVLAPSEDVMRAVYYFATLKWGILLPGLAWLALASLWQRRNLSAGFRGTANDQSS